MVLAYLSHLIEINGDSYVFGLSWQPMDRETAGLPMARIYAERNKALTYVVHKERESSCLGLGTIDEIGIASAASSAARTKKGRWIAVIKISAGRYWLIGAAHGEIVPGTDRIFDSGSDALVELRSISEVMAFDEVYLAEGIEGRDDEPDMNVEDVVVPGKGTTTMNPTQNTSDQLKDVAKKHRGKLAISLAAVFGLYFSSSLIFDYIQDKEAAQLEASRNMDALLSKKAAEEKLIERKKNIENQWLLQPLASEYIRTCRKYINQLSTPVAGWVRKERRCALNAQVAFMRDWGFTKRILQLSAHRGAKIQNANENKKIFIKEFPSSSRKTVSLLSPAETVRNTKASLEASRLLFKIGNNTNVDKGFFRDSKYFRLPVAIENISDVQKLGSLLDPIPGAVIKSMSKSDDALWSISMEVYSVQSH